jgi:hypothetical protein
MRIHINRSVNSHRQLIVIFLVFELKRTEARLHVVRIYFATVIITDKRSLFYKFKLYRDGDTLWESMFLVALQSATKNRKSATKNV